MSQNMVGADIAGLHQLAQSFERSAIELQATAARVRDGIRISAWVGPAAVRFRVTWDSEHSVALRRVAAELSAAATCLHREAEQQEQTSSAATGTDPWTSSGSRSPSSTAELLAADVHDNDGDGVRIQKIVGADGEERFIVYINGTGSSGNPFDMNSRFDWYENGASINGQASQSSNYVREQMAAAGITASSAVMLVGYSQGGIIAQNIARSHEFGSPLVITRGSPQVAGSMGDIDILRLEVKGDAAVESGPWNTGNDFARGLGLDRGSGTDYKYTHDLNMGPLYDLPGVQHLGAGVAIHTSLPLYEEAANAFDQSREPEAVRLQQRISEFQGGQVIKDSDPDRIAT